MKRVHFVIGVAGVALSFGLVQGSAFARIPAAVDAKKGTAPGLYAEGVKAYDAGALPKAESFFREALKKDPHFDKARFQLAVTLHLSGNDEGALDELSRVRKDPEVIRMVPVLKGEAQLKLGRWQDSVKTWKSLQADNPDLKAMRFQGLAKAYEGLGKSSDAADAWSGYLELQIRPSSPTFRLIAVNRIKAGEKEKALKYCDESAQLKNHPSYQLMCKAHVYRAAFEASKSADDRKAALEEISESVKKDSKNTEASELLERWKAEG